MKTINFNDTEARISNIDGSTVELEWGGPDDRMVYEFDLSKLGKVAEYGTNGNAGRTGWAILDGPCNLAVGDTIPLAVCEKLELNRTTSAGGPILRGYLGDFRVEADPGGKWVHVIDDDGNAACFDQHPELGWAEGGDQRILDKITPEDWAVIKTALEEAAK
jgi:hypothetical protein